MYLVLQKNTYHFRLALNAEQRKRLGKREIKQSLQTRNKTLARRDIVISNPMLTYMPKKDFILIKPSSGWCFPTSKDIYNSK